MMMILFESKTFQIRRALNNSLLYVTDNMILMWGVEPPLSNSVHLLKYLDKEGVEHYQFNEYKWNVDSTFITYYPVLLFMAGWHRSSMSNHGAYAMDERTLLK